MSTVLDPTEELNKIAEGVVSDVSEMVSELEGEEGGRDLGYNLWVEELPGRAGDSETFGVIDMGDLYQGAYVWTNGEWEPISDDPYLLVEQILSYRRFRSGW